MCIQFISKDSLSASIPSPQKTSHPLWSDLFLLGCLSSCSGARGGQGGQRWNMFIITYKQVSVPSTHALHTHSQTHTYTHALQTQTQTHTPIHMPCKHNRKHTHMEPSQNPGVLVCNPSQKTARIQLEPRQNPHIEQSIDQNQFWEMWNNMST